VLAVVVVDPDCVRDADDFVARDHDDHSACVVTDAVGLADGVCDQPVANAETFPSRVRDWLQCHAGSR